MGGNGAKRENLVEPLIGPQARSQGGLYKMMHHSNTTDGKCVSTNQDSLDDTQVKVKI